MSWIQFVYADRLKAHTLPSQLVEIHQEYLDDGYELHTMIQAAGLGSNPKIVTTCNIDLGGPLYVDRPVEAFFVDGLELTVASEEIPLFLDTWMTLPKRQTRSSNAGYYKLHGAMGALVLMPAMYPRLMTDIHERVPVAAARADEFTKCRGTIKDAIRDVNARLSRGPVRS